MSARPADRETVDDACALAPLTHASIDAVVALERAVYPFPWTRGNFVDSLVAGYLCWMLVDRGAGLIAYCIAMRGADELHVLNLTVAEAQRRRGHARRLLAELVRVGRGEAAKRIWLEVRQSNAVARDAYARMGFATVGMRRAYYPAAAATREDAFVMSLGIDGVGDGDALD